MREKVARLLNTNLLHNHRDKIYLYHYVVDNIQQLTDAVQKGGQSVAIRFLCLGHLKSRKNCGGKFEKNC